MGVKLVANEALKGEIKDLRTDFRERIHSPNPKKLGGSNKSEASDEGSLRKRATKEASHAIPSNLLICPTSPRSALSTQRD